MRLWWRGGRDVTPVPVRPPSEATKARMKAEAELRATRAQTPRYRDLGASLKEIRERNNFAAAILTTFQGVEQ